MLPPGEGKTISFSGNRVTLIHGGHPGWAYSVLEWVSEPGIPGPPLHIHTTTHESVLRCGGHVWLPSGRENLRGRRRSVRLRAQRLEHTYRNKGQTPSKMLTTISPPGFERYFEELAEGLEAAGDDEQAEKLAGIFSGQMGGPLANVVPLISENLGMEAASIEHNDDGRRHRVKVGDAIDVEIEDAVSPLDPDGPPPKLTETRHPTNSEMTPARALSARVQGLGIDYSADGKSGLSAPFSWSG